MIPVTERLAGSVHSDPTLWNAPAPRRERVPEVRALIVRYQTRVTAQLLGTAPYPRVTGRVGAGLDNSDLAAARTRGSPVTAGDKTNTIAVAACVLAAMLHSARALAAADVLGLHVPLIPVTRHPLNARTLSKRPQRALLINTSRCGVIDEPALLAVLDVREVEPLPADSPLLACPSAPLTPHIAGLPAQARTSRLVVSDVLQVLAGEQAIGRVP